VNSVFGVQSVKRNGQIDCSVHAARRGSWVEIPKLIKIITI